MQIAQPPETVAPNAAAKTAKISRNRCTMGCFSRHRSISFIICAAPKPTAGAVIPHDLKHRFPAPACGCGVGRSQTHAENVLAARGPPAALCAACKWPDRAAREDAEAARFVEQLGESAERAGAGAVAALR